MPIDYSNTLIYKITCKDVNVEDIYVGHTTDFVQRRKGHERSCIHTKSVNYNCKLYQVIRANGGWNNWKMEIINFFNCKNLYEAREKEQEYFIALKATLNSVEPLPTQKPKVKKLKEEKPKVIKEKHIKQNIELSNNNTKFTCSTCNISCIKKNDWDRHIITRKHIKHIQPEELNVVKQNFTCKCGKIYKNNSGLWKHSKICKYDNEQTSIIVNDDSEFYKHLLLEFIEKINNFKKQ